MLRFLQAILTKFLALWIICSALLAYHFPEQFAFLQDWTSPALAFILFSMGLTLSRESLKRVIIHPRNALLGVLGKWTLTLGVSLFLAFLSLFYSTHHESFRRQCRPCFFSAVIFTNGLCGTAADCAGSRSSMEMGK